MAKVKVATAWLDCCSGCHMSFLDLDEVVIDLAGLLEFHASPITDIKNITPVDVGIIEGSVSTSRDEEIIKEMRANCKILMVLGDCACFGGINSMSNMFDKEELLSRCYSTESTTEGSRYPRSEELPIPGEVRPVNHVVKVDCYVPGCPPSAKAIHYALAELLAGRIPVLPSDMMRFD